MINRLSNPINRNRLAAKISKVMSSSIEGKSCAQDMREADQEFVRDLMERIEEETCLKFTEKKGYLKSNCWDLDCRRSFFKCLICSTQ